MIRETNKPKKQDKRIVFAEQYIICNRNATIAYKAVYGSGLNDNTAAVNASKLLRNPKIQDYLRERFSILELDADYVLKNLKNLAENAKTDNTKLQSVIAIGKTLGMFSDNVVVDSKSDYERRSKYVNDYVKNVMFKPYVKQSEQLSEH